MKSEKSKSQENQEKKNKKGINYFGHILRASLWFVIFAKKYGWFLANDPYYQFIYPHLKLYLFSVTLIVLIILVIKKKGFFKKFWPIISFYFKFLIFFPIIIYLIFRIVIYLLGITSKLTKLPRRLEAIVLEIIFFILAVILISTKTNVFVLSASMTVLMFCIIGLWLCIYSWTTNPFALFVRLDNLVEKLWNFFTLAFITLFSTRRLGIGFLPPGIWVMIF